MRLPALIVAALCAGTTSAEPYRLPLFVDETPCGQTGVLRIHNESDASGTLSIYAIDDSSAKSGPAILTLAAASAVELDADDLASGDAAIRLADGVGTINGDVRLEIVTDLSINSFAYLRTSDGTLTVLHDEVAARTTPSGSYQYRVPVFNPANNMAQAISLRLISPSIHPAMVSISGIDDTGTVAMGGSMSLMLAAGGARTLTAQQVEAGGTGLTGQLGAGTGKWRLMIASDQPIEVVNLVTSSTGRLDNLSSAGRDGLAPTNHDVLSERFTRQVIATQSEGQSSKLSIQAEDKFSETAVSGDDSASTRSGIYAYRCASTDAGELTLDYTQGDSCVTNLHFSSRRDGWFASRCGKTEGEQAIWHGGSWRMSEDTGSTMPDPSGLRFATTGRPGNQNYLLNQAISALVLPTASGGAGALTYGLAPTVPGSTWIRPVASSQAHQQRLARMMSPTPPPTSRVPPTASGS